MGLMMKAPDDPTSAAPAASETRGGTSTGPRSGLDSALSDLVDSMAEHRDVGSRVFEEEIDLPELRTDFNGRQALVVMRGHHFKEDLAMLRSYIREYKPVLVGVDRGADAILEAGYTPDLIIGDLDAVSDAAVNTTAELLVHPRDGVGDDGIARLDRADLDYLVLDAPGSNEDVALLISDSLGAQLIVAVGAKDTFADLTDSARDDMATTFLTRLRVGSKLIDAKGVALLYRRSVGSWQLLILAAAGLLAVFAALFATAAGQTLIGLIAAQLDGFFGWVHSLFSRAPASQSLFDGWNALRGNALH